MRADGDWEGWLAFVADGVTESAAAAVTTARRLADLAQADREHIRAVGRLAGSALQVHHALLERPVSTAGSLVTRTGLSAPAVNRVLAALDALGIVRELTGRRRDRLFSYAPCLHILSEGTEPL